jgi:hypothetical protein
VIVGGTAIHFGSLLKAAFIRMRGPLDRHVWDPLECLLRRLEFRGSARPASDQRDGRHGRNHKYKKEGLFPHSIESILEHGLQALALIPFEFLKSKWTTPRAARLLDTSGFEEYCPDGKILRHTHPRKSLGHAFARGHCAATQQEN